jgi:predicted dehydrogenase
LCHENGRFSRITASRITEKKMRSIQATCRDMFIDCELLRKEIIINRQSSIRQDHDHYSIASLEEKVEVRPQEALLTELQAFAGFCRGKNVQVPTGRDGLEAMRVCEQIRHAIENPA